MNQSSPIWSANDLNSNLAMNVAMGQNLPQLQSPYNKSINMDTESMLSGYSERSKKGRNGTYSSIANNNASPNSPILSVSSHMNPALTPTNPYHTNYQLGNASQISSTLRSVGRQSYQSTNNNNINNKNDQIYSRNSKIESPYDISNRQETIEVQMMQQDDNWADNTTAITGNTSDHSGSFEDLPRLNKDIMLGSNFQMQCRMWSGTVIAIVLSSCAFLSPILMVIFPKLDIFEWRTKECGPECDGLMISFVFKLLILLIGSWAVFFRRPKATMPRVYVYRTAVLALLVIFMIAYWLFYSVRIAEKRFSEEDAISYYSIVLFAISLVDALLFIHYLAVILLEIRHLDSHYFIKVVRSPDGQSKCYTLGKISIQRASVWILEKYYQDFPIYNSHLERIPSKKGRKGSVSSRNGTSALKYYDLDGVEDQANENSTNLTINPLQLSPKSILAQNTAANAATKTNRPYMNGGSSIPDGRGNRRDRDNASHHSGYSGHHHRHHNDRFYEEHEYERRVKKRRARLVSITEEAFTHIKRIHQDRAGPSIPMDPKEASQAIFPSIAKTLQKFLRVTRQQPRHTIQSIMEHLTTCLVYDLSPKTFLEKYLCNGPVLANDEEKKPIQTWSLICDTLLSRSIESGTMFLLRQGDVSLLVTVYNLPHLNIAEEVVDPKSNKFVFKLNSETSV